MDTNIISSILNDVKISDSDNNPINVLKETDAPIDPEVVGAFRNVIYDKVLGSTLKVNADGSLNIGNSGTSKTKTYMINTYTPLTNITTNEYRHCGFNNYGANSFNVNPMGLANPRAWFVSHNSTTLTITFNYIYVDSNNQEVYHIVNIPPAELIALETNIISINKWWVSNINNFPAVLGNTFTLKIHMGTVSGGFEMAGCSINQTSNAFYTSPINTRAYLNNVKIKCSKPTDIYLNKWSSTGAKSVIMLWSGISNIDLITSSTPIGDYIEAGETIGFGVKDHDVDVNVNASVISEDF